MRLFEAILDANNRAVAGDSSAGLHPADFAGELPVVALTCIDARLNAFFPNVLGIPAEQFIWLRNAGNIITGPLSSTMRSLALACAIKGGREIAIIGHNDCKVRGTTIGELTDRLKALGIDRSQLPENLIDYFGIFASERQNVIRGVDVVRASPLIGPKVPVHGLMVDIQSGKLDWIVNGYETLDRPAVKLPGLQLPELGAAVENFIGNAELKLGEMKFPETKIGELAAKIGQEVSAPVEQIFAPKPAAAPAAPVAPPPIVAKPVARPRPVPIPPPIHLYPRGKGR
jgi:carbonic anhydrase